jgi:hypothetical protein
MVGGSFVLERGAAASGLGKGPPAGKGPSPFAIPFLSAFVSGLRRCAWGGDFRLLRRGWCNGIAENRAACHFESMRLIETFVSPDTKQKVSLYQRDDGLFSFDEMHEDFDDLIGHYWALGPQSGIYADEASARADIQATTPWLRAD